MSALKAPSQSPNSPASIVRRVPPVLPSRAVLSEQMQRVLATPIVFYGRVIDQNGDPVQGATVNYTALDKFDAPGSHYEGRSGVDGSFSLSGIGGAVLSVGVMSEGYYMIEGKSASAFAYGIGPDSTRQEPPTKEKPAVFVLQKMGIAEPLISLKTGGIKVPKNGTPVIIDIETGKIGTTSANGIKVEAWTQIQGPPSKDPYDWRCRISVPGGGLIERQEQFAFEAPIDGYQEYDEVAMKSTEGSWKKRFEKDYFARLPSGNYARFRFRFTSGGNDFFTMEAYLNPNEAGLRPGEIYCQSGRVA